MNKYARCVRNETYFRGDAAENFTPDLLVGEVYRVLPLYKSVKILSIREIRVLF